jgi:predicted transcriptional regulator
MPRRLKQEPITALLGVQPERDGVLQCLECGVRYRGIAQHVRQKHGIDPDDYRRDHELPRTLALWPQELS